jgi:rare lipoprotein A (peptidoglycan hydrolase)
MPSARNFPSRAYQTNGTVGWLVLFLSLLLAQGCALVSTLPNWGRQATIPGSSRSQTVLGIADGQQAAIIKSSSNGLSPQRSLKIPGATVGAHIGEASWYGPGFNGKKTANGETFDDSKFTAAHKTLPLGSKARVTNIGTGGSVEVEINDRGPYVNGRIIDLSHAAAKALGIIDAGIAMVRVELLSESPKSADAREK